MSNIKKKSPSIGLSVIHGVPKAVHGDQSLIGSYRSFVEKKKKVVQETFLGGNVTI